MGPKAEGTALSWEEIIPHIDYIKEHGIQQFINIYNREKMRYDPELKWGDEIEYTVVKFDHDAKKVRVCCKNVYVLAELKLAEKFNELTGKKTHGVYHHEASAYMIESTPVHPYGDSLDKMLQVETNMAERRREIQKVLEKDESIMSVCFPALGTPDFTYPFMKPESEHFAGAESIFWPPRCYNLAFQRFSSLMRNIMQRRGSKLPINVPIYRDKNTSRPYIEDLSSYGDSEQYKDAKSDHIFLDHMAFGDGLCCVQATFQAPTLDDARFLYDQFIPFCPILLALSASTPIFRSKLSDVDCRYGVLDDASDDRTLEERGEVPLKNQKFRLERGRHGPTSSYIHPSSEKYNDHAIQYDEILYQKLRAGSVDESLAKFIAHLFVRDPVVVFRESLEQNDVESSEHFESILSTNWNNVRLKPPPREDPSCGWRVEFRPTEIQLTDFENAAYVCFIALISRIIFTHRYNFLLPISMIIENMKRAEKRDAIHTQKFYFRTDLSRSNEYNNNYNSNDETIQELTLNEIVNGTKSGYPGIVQLIRQYLETADANNKTLNMLSQYIDLISKRASGEIWTLSRWMRDFVDKHPAYMHDSEVPSEVVYNMFQKMDAISRGKEHCEKLLGKPQTLQFDINENEFLLQKDLKHEIFDASPFACSLKTKGENLFGRKSPKAQRLIDVIGL